MLGILDLSLKLIDNSTPTRDYKSLVPHSVVSAFLTASRLDARQVARQPINISKAF